MITSERKKELLEMQEYYDCLNDDEWEEEKQSFSKWWSNLTIEEIEFLEEENDKYMEFVRTTEKEIIELIKERESK